jgi:hypothetical protein
MRGYTSMCPSVRWFCRGSNGYASDMFRIGTLLLLIWFLIGVLAAWQRDYFKDEPKTCAKTGTIVATIAAGPLNYVGVNPKVHCPNTLPQPSK